MINVEKGSLWYRVALYGVFFEEHHLSPNLCPFMRRVALGTVLILCYVFLAALVLLCIFTPILQTILVMLHGPLFWEGNSPMVIGLAIWAIALVCCVLWLFYDTDIGEVTRKTVRETYHNAEIDKWLVVEWIYAFHHKICPSLSFTGEITDGHISKTEEVDE